MLHNFSVDLAHSFYAGKEHTNDDIEIYAYGLEVFLATALQLVTFLTLGLILGQALTTVAFLIGFIPLRSVAGGYHAQTHLRCFLGFALIYTLFLGMLQIVPLNLSAWMAISFVALSAIAVLALAPLSDKNRPIGPKRRKVFRRQSLQRFLICAALIVALSTASLLGIAIPQQVVLALSIGQLAAAGSLVAAKLKTLYTTRRMQAI